MLFFLIFLIIPLMEIGLFVVVGSEIGVLSTLGLCFLTAIAGSALIRHQGLGTLISARAAMEQNELPVDDLFTGLCLLISGLLLLTPGFFTDCIGFLLLIPQFRHFIKTYAKKHVKLSGLQTHNMSQHDINASRSNDNNRDNGVIDGDYTRLDDE